MTQLRGVPQVEGLSVSIEAPLSTSDVGRAVPLQANVSGGVPPYRLGWNDSAGGWATGGSWAVNASAPGSVEVVASASDSLGDVGVSSLLVTFVAGPTLSMSATPEAVDEGVPFTLEVTATDGVAPLYIDWSVGPGTSNGTIVDLAGGTSAVPAVATLPGAVVATADLVDSAGGRATVSTAVAASYAPPSLDLGPGPAYAEAGALFSLDGKVVGGAPPIDWTVLPSAPVASPVAFSGTVGANGSFGWGAAFDAAGNDSLSVIVTDSEGASASAELPVSVLPPLSVRILSPTGPVPAEGALLVTAVIGDGYPPYQWTLTSAGSLGPSGSVWVTGNVSLSVEVGNVTGLSLELSVTDGLGGTALDSLSVAVVPPGVGSPGDPAPSVPPSLFGEAATPAAVLLAVLTLVVLVTSWWRKNSGAPPNALGVIKRLLARGGTIEPDDLLLRGREAGVGELAMQSTIDELLGDGRLAKRSGPSAETVLEWGAPDAAGAMEGSQ